MRITADVIDDEQCVECSDLEQQPPKCEKRLRLVVKNSPRAKSARQYRSAFNTMLRKFKQLYMSDSPLPLSVLTNKETFFVDNQVDDMAAKDVNSPSHQGINQEWLHDELSKMKKEITRDVTTNVLHHLMGSLRNTEDSITKEIDDACIHKGIYCDNCDQIICGIRYKCGNCSDYDLCEACENIQDVHDNNHIFLKIRNPMPQQSKPKRRRKKVVKTSVYASCSDMQLTGDLAVSKSSLGKLATDKYQMNAKFLRDVTVPDGSAVAPGVRFLKSWEVKNTGHRPWTHETTINYMSGSSALKPLQSKFEVPKLQPGEEGVVSVMFKAPDVLSTYQSHWGFVHKDETFGDRIWCIVHVTNLNASFPSVNPTTDISVNTMPEHRISGDDGSDYSCDEDLPIGGCQASVSRDVNSHSNADNIQVLKETNAKQNRGNVSQVTEVLTAVHKVQVAEVLTAVHEVQERGEVVSRKLAASSYTATPNNTPFDLSPPKSPEPPKSSSKNIRPGIAQMISATSTEEKQNKTTKIDGENEEKYSTLSLSSSESDAEFVVIPMPRCFTFDERISSSEVIQTVTSAEGLKGSVEYATVQLDASSLATDNTFDQNVKNHAKEFVLPAQVAEDSTLLEDCGNLCVETTVKVIENKCSGSSDGSIVVSEIKVGCPSSKSSVVSSQEQAAPEAQDLNREDPLCDNNNVETPEVYQILEPESDDHNSSGTYPKVLMTASAPLEEEVTEQEERTIQVLPEGLVNGALSAAATVFNTARAVIAGRQSRSEQQDAGLQTDRASVPFLASEMDPMQQLIEMGFGNRPKNEQLLKKHKGDVAAVVAELVSLNDNDWYASRHAVGSGMTDFD